jgi:hypothetical protein
MFVLERRIFLNINGKVVYVVLATQKFGLLAEIITMKFNLLKTRRNLLHTSAVNTFHHGYKNHSVNDVYSKGRCLFLDPYKTQRKTSTM